MSHLKFYVKEQDMFKEAYGIKVSDSEAKKIVRKLLRHFGSSEKAESVNVRFYGNRQTGNYSAYGIRLSHNPSVGIICHEVAHSFHWGHDKKLMRWIGKLNRYCKKKEYWKNGKNIR